MLPARRVLDTLPARIWSATSESIYIQAALPALLLIMFTTMTLLLTTHLRLCLESGSRAYAYN